MKGIMMTNEIKTKEDLQNDAVAIVYGVFKILKYAFIFALVCIACFFYVILTARG